MKPTQDTMVRCANVPCPNIFRQTYHGGKAKKCCSRQCNFALWSKKNPRVYINPETGEFSPESFKLTKETHAEPIKVETREKKKPTKYRPRPRSKKRMKDIKETESK